jgi:hypothetical protein
MINQGAKMIEKENNKEPIAQKKPEALKKKHKHKIYQ